MGLRRALDERDAALALALDERATARAEVAEARASEAAACARLQAFEEKLPETVKSISAETLAASNARTSSRTRGSAWRRRSRR